MTATSLTSSADDDIVRIDGSCCFKENAERRGIDLFVLVAEREKRSDLWMNMQSLQGESRWL